MFNMGFDLHGVLDKYPEKFKKALKELKEQNSFPSEIYIVSGPPKDEIEKELLELGFEKSIHYDDVLSVVSYLKEKGINMWQDEKGTWWASDEEWWSSKGIMCDKHNIALLIDDSEGYRITCEKLGITFTHINDVVK